MILSLSSEGEFFITSLKTISLEVKLLLPSAHH
jgi:hypothetical protein